MTIFDDKTLQTHYKQWMIIIYQEQVSAQELLNVSDRLYIIYNLSSRLTDGDRVSISFDLVSVVLQ